MPDWRGLITAMLLNLTASQLLDPHSSAELCPVEILDAHLERLESGEPDVNAFAFVDVPGAKAATRGHWRSTVLCDQRVLDHGGTDAETQHQ